MNTMKYLKKFAGGVALLLIIKQTLFAGERIPTRPYYLMKGDGPYEESTFGLCRMDGTIVIPVKYGYLGSLRNRNWWAFVNSERDLARIFMDDGSLYVTNSFYSSVDPLTGWCGAQETSGGEILVSSNGNGPYFFSAIIHTNGVVRTLGKGMNPSVNGRYTTIQTDSSMAIYDIKKQAAIPETGHDTVSVNMGEAFIVTDDNKFGTIDSYGHQIIPPIFDCAYYLSCGHSDSIVAKKGEDVFLITSKGKPFEEIGTSLSLGEHESPSGTYREVMSTPGKIGVLNCDEETVAIPCEFDEVFYLSDFALSGAQNGKFVLASSQNGKILESGDHEFVLVEAAMPDSGDIWKSIDSSGRTVEIYYLQGNNLQQIKGADYALQKKSRTRNGEWGCQFIVFKDTRKGLSGVLSRDGKRCIIPLQGNYIISAWQDKIRLHKKSEKRDERNYIVMDTKGNFLLHEDKKTTFIDSRLDSSGYARIVCDGKAGLIDGDCNFVLPCRYEDVGHFGEGLVPAKENDKWGFVELSGKWAISPRFENARSFRNGFAPVRVNNKWGFIGKDGKPATPFFYEDVKDVRESHFRAQVNGKWGIFALDGTCTLPAEYDKIIASDEPEYGDPR